MAEKISSTGPGKAAVSRAYILLQSLAFLLAFGAGAVIGFIGWPWWFAGDQEPADEDERGSLI